jgi:hypothetical protein
VVALSRRLQLHCKICYAHLEQKLGSGIQRFEFPRFALGGFQRIAGFIASAVTEWSDTKCNIMRSMGLANRDQRKCP